MSHLELVFDKVIDLTVLPLLLWEICCWNPAKIGLDFDESLYVGCYEMLVWP